MGNEEKKKNKKKNIKSFFHIIAILIVDLLAVNICMTIFFTQKIRIATLLRKKEKS